MTDSARPPDFEADFLRIREQLACPACYGDLRLDTAQLVCVQCGRVFPIVDGIPELIAE
jgi:uncharacterized protein YbaR (Trm112 family)